MAREHLPEFPSAWHQQAYLEGLERELLGYRKRQQEFEGNPEAEKAIAEAKSGEEAVLAELKRLGRGQKTAEKRPRAASSE